MTDTKEVLKAGIGYYALDRVCYPKSNRIEVLKVPVIGWRIAHDTEMGGVYVEPLCAEALSELWRGEILHPDGTITPTTMWKSYDHFETSVTMRDLDDTTGRLTTTVFNRHAELETKPKLPRAIVLRASDIQVMKKAR